LLARLNGEVRSVDERSGEKNGRAWSMRFARVAFSDLDFVEVLLPDRASVRVGDAVDWVVRIEVRGGYLGVSLHGDYVHPQLVPTLSAVAGE
jgi:hypothetical protein